MTLSAVSITLCFLHLRQILKEIIVKVHQFFFHLVFCFQLFDLIGNVEVFVLIEAHLDGWLLQILHGAWDFDSGVSVEILCNAPMEGCLILSFVVISKQCGGFLAHCSFWVSDSFEYSIQRSLVFAFYRALQIWQHYLNVLHLLKLQIKYYSAKIFLSFSML